MYQVASGHSMENYDCSKGNLDQKTSQGKLGSSVFLRAVHTVTDSLSFLFN